MVEDITTENTNVKIDLQVQKDLVVALRLKLNEEPSGHQETLGSLPDSQQQCDECKFVSKDRVLMQYHKKTHRTKSILVEKAPINNKPNSTSNEEGPLPEGKRKCDQCYYKNKNRVLLQAHKLKRHKENNGHKCRMCEGIFPI